MNCALKASAVAVDGTCYGLGNGSISIGLVVAPCDGYPVTDALTGWNSASFLLVTEILPSSSPQGNKKRILNSNNVFVLLIDWNSFGSKL